MKILETTGLNKDFMFLSQQLENYQFELIPQLKQADYNLTENMNSIIGFVVYNNNVPIACIGLKPINKTTCEIVRVYVEKEYRNNGLATKLFSKILGLAKNLDYKNVEMVAWAKATPAINLYKKLGFTASTEKLSQITNSNYIVFTKNL